MTAPDLPLGDVGPAGGPPADRAVPGAGLPRADGTTTGAGDAPASRPYVGRPSARAEGPRADGPLTDRTFTGHPLAGRAVLITRAPDRARSLADLLEGLGARVVVAPVTTTAPPESPEALDAAVRALDDYAWVAVTSVNAVDALHAAATRTTTPLSPGLSDARKGGASRDSDNAGVSVVSDGGKGGASRGSDNSIGAPQRSTEATGPRWAAVGPATARALQAAGVPVSLEATGTAADLAARFPAPPNLSEPRQAPPLRGSDTTDAPALSDSRQAPPLRGSDTTDALELSGAPGVPERPAPDTTGGVRVPSGAQGVPEPSAPDNPGAGAGAGASRNRRVLLPLGDLARSVLADGLRAAGWDVHTVVAYRTVPLALPDDVVDAARGGAIDLGVVAAGSAAREIARQLGGAAPPVVAIGQPSAEAAVAAGLTVVGVAENPTDGALAAALVAAASGAGRSAVHSAAPTMDTAPTTRSDT